MRRLKRTLVALSDRQSASTIMVICKDYIPQERNILSSYIQASGLLYGDVMELMNVLRNAGYTKVALVALEIRSGS